MSSFICFAISNSFSVAVSLRAFWRKCLKNTNINNNASPKKTKHFEIAFTHLKCFSMKRYVTDLHENSFSCSFNGFQQLDNKPDFRNQKLVQIEMLWWKRFNGFHSTYGYNLTFLCYILDREMINCSDIQSFFETFPQTFMCKCRPSITNKSAPFEGSMNFKVWSSKLNLLAILHW